jgi:hypothetical protein
MSAKWSDSRHPQKGIVRGVHIAYSGLLATCLCLSFAGGANAAESPDASLQRLEQKFFQHSYAKDSETDRIERIEKMVFGETRKGSDQQRLDSLVQAVPEESNDLPDQDAAPKSQPTAEAPARQQAAPVRQEPTPPAAAPRRTAVKPSSQGAPTRTAKPAAAPTEASAPPPPNSSKYPAVTAIENKILNKTYEDEPVEERLNRVEAKVFGKPSRSSDLSERVDRLKQSTGIDVAGRPPQGSDWTDDDDDIMSNGRSLAMPRTAPPTASADGEDGMSFSGRNLRQDFKNFGRQNFSGMSSGGGSYGMGTGSTGSFGSSSAGASGAYGFGDDGDLPPSAPQISRRYSAPNAVPSGMGLTGQVTVLENEVLGKTFTKDALPARVARLEEAVFPNDKTVAAKALPDRVGKLVATVGLSSAPTSSRRLAQRSRDPDFPDLDSDLPQVAPQRGGLGRIVNGLGNMVNGGFTGGYPAGTLATDPQTGMLFDARTGNLIDPNTGMVIGRRVTNAYQNMPYGMGMPMAPVGAYPYPTFGNGFSSMGSGIHFGTGMGMGGMGVGRGFGMWP